MDLEGIPQGSEVRPHMVPGVLLRIQTGGTFGMGAITRDTQCPLWTEDASDTTMLGTLRDGELVIGLGPSGARHGIRVLTREGLYGVVYPTLVRIVT